MEVSTEFKVKVRTAILQARENYGGNDTAFAKTLDINKSILSRIKSGETDKVLDNGKWLSIARMLNLDIKNTNWKVARTEVYQQLEDNFHFCQQNQTSMVLVDDCGIGKTFCGQIIVSKMKNAFYIDCSQAKSRQQFIKAMAHQVGSGSVGKYSEVLGNLIYYLNMLDDPFIVLDEAGDLEYPAFLELKGIMNGTAGQCAFYMMGADGLRAKINKGINNHRVGFAEIFSRFSDDFVTIVPEGKEDRLIFYRKLISDVAVVNLTDKTKLNEIVHKCITKTAKQLNPKEKSDKIKSLRYLKTLIKVSEI